MSVIPFKDYLIRESHTRILNILRGDVPQVKTMGIMTGWNPLGQSVSPQENNSLNRNLIDKLRAAHYKGFKVESPVYGQFGNLEKGYLIPHISKEFLVELASDFCQKAVIFGTRKEKEGEGYVEFEWIETSAEDCKSATPESYATTQTRNIVLAGETAQKRTDFYSASPYPVDIENKKPKPGVTPRKFWIPFFDDDYATASYQAGKRNVSTQSSKSLDFGDEDGQLRKAESYEPAIDVHEDVSFIFSKLPSTEKVKQIVEEIRICERGIYDSLKTENYKWICRGNLNRLVKELSLALR